MYPAIAFLQSKLSIAGYDISFSVPLCNNPICGSALSTISLLRQQDFWIFYFWQVLLTYTSPSNSNTNLNTPCAAGCCGPKLTVKFFNSFTISFFLNAISFSSLLCLQEKRDSNPQHTALETAVLPLELFS
jgi:hypothetical protein